MAVFPSREWCEQAILLLNSDPEAVRAGEGWKGDFGAVVEAERGKLQDPFVVYCLPKEGRIEEFRVLVDPDDLDEFEPTYLATAPYSVWKGLISGQLDPIEALVGRKLRLQGDVQQLIERMQYKGIADRVLGQVQTEFIDER